MATLINQEKSLITEQNKKWIQCKETTNRNGQVTKREYKVLPMELSKYIKENLNYILVRGEANEGSLIYVFADGYYKWVDEKQFKGFIKNFIPYQLRKSREIQEVFLDLTTENNFVNYEDLNCNENIINFEDGILDLTTMELQPHSPDILNTIQIPAKYKDIEKAPFEAPVFDNYLKRLCNNDEETCKLLLQCLGIAISNVYAYRTKKALFLVGQGNTGKSQLKKLAEYLIGYNNVTTMDLKRISEQFGAAALYQKRLAGCNDMSYQRIDDMSVFKQLTGGDMINAEFKHKNGFNFLFKGFLWFNCNKLPRFGGDTGKWVYDRIMPIYCENVIPKEEQDPLLFEKMLKEKNSIIKKTLIELKKVINNNYTLIEPQYMKEMKEKYEIQNNTLLSFINEYCEVITDIPVYHRTKRSTFKHAYDAWVRINNNGKGKLNSQDMNTILETKFNEKYIKSNGIWYMSKIIVLPEAFQELDIWE